MSYFSRGAWSPISSSDKGLNTDVRRIKSKEHHERNKDYDSLTIKVFALGLTSDPLWEKGLIDAKNIF